MHLRVSEWMNKRKLWKMEEDTNEWAFFCLRTTWHVLRSIIWRTLSLPALQSSIFHCPHSTNNFTQRRTQYYKCEDFEMKWNEKNEDTLSIRCESKGSTRFIVKFFNEFQLILFNGITPTTKKLFLRSCEFQNFLKNVSVQRDSSINESNSNLILLWVKFHCKNRTIKQEIFRGQDQLVCSLIECLKNCLERDKSSFIILSL